MKNSLVTFLAGAAMAVAALLVVGAYVPLQEYARASLALNQGAQVIYSLDANTTFVATCPDPDASVTAAVWQEKRIYSTGSGTYPNVTTIRWRNGTNGLVHAVGADYSNLTGGTYP